MEPLSVAFGLAQYAPSIIKWLTGSDKAEEAAQKVVEVAQAVTGKTGDAALQAIAADPALALQFKQSIIQIEAEMDKAYLADRADARKRDVAYIQSGKRNVRADLMVLGATVGLIACLVVLVQFKSQIPGEVVGILSTISGLFGACLRDAFQFEFGSSRGSREKDAILGGRA